MSIAELADRVYMARHRMLVAGHRNRDLSVHMNREDFDECVAESRRTLHEFRLWSPSTTTPAPGATMLGIPIVVDPDFERGKVVLRAEVEA